MSYLLSSLGTGTEEQRVARAAAHLRAVVFSRLSSEHVIALALLPKLSAISSQAYETEQVIQGHRTQDLALSEHLQALGLPLTLNDLRGDELERLKEGWITRLETLPAPFCTLLASLLESAEALKS